MLPKLLLLILVVVGLWYGVRWMARVQRVLERQERKAEQQPGRAPARAEPKLAAEDMQRCPVCATFVTGTSSCGKAGCPYG
jgi:hypothetical protein